MSWSQADEERLKHDCGLEEPDEQPEEYDGETDRDEDDERKDSWMPNDPLSGLNKTPESILDDGDDEDDGDDGDGVMEIEVVDLTDEKTGDEDDEEGDEEDDERDAERPPPKRPRAEGSFVSHATLKRTDTTLSALSA